MPVSGCVFPPNRDCSVDGDGGEAHPQPGEIKGAMQPMDTVVKENSDAPARLRVPAVFVLAAFLTNQNAWAIQTQVNLGSAVPLSGHAQFYRILSATTVTITHFHIVGGNATITYQ